MICSFCLQWFAAVHKLHYAIKSIIHEQNLSQDSKAPKKNSTHKSQQSILPSSLILQPVLLRWRGPRQLFGRRSSFSSDQAPVSTDASFIREVSSHTEECGLVMISRDYGWLMVGKYIRNRRLWQSGRGGVFPSR